MTTNTAKMRRCIGSAKFGIEQHEAPVEDFPKQPSQRDGLGRMCKTHWNAYTTPLRKAALARKAAEGESAVEGVTATSGDDAESPETPKRGRRRAAKEVEVAQEPAAG